MQNFPNLIYYPLTSNMSENQFQKQEWAKRTKPKLLFNAYANEDEAQHVCNQMNNTSMQPDASEKSPSLMPLDNSSPL